ncbi:MAG: DUF2130 domain-containing protein [Elusimicrobia bacterium]|nr:DUF2130 domain-containing protein [Elusimicrobiota bacterium]
MTDQSIVCPHCGKRIPLTEALTHPIEEKLKGEMETALKKKDREHSEALSGLRTQLTVELEQERKSIEATARENAKMALSVEFKDLKAQLDEKTKSLEDAQKRELDLNKREREMGNRESRLKIDVQQTIEKERRKIRDDAVAEGLEIQKIEVEDLKAQLGQKSKLLDESRSQELSLRKQRQELEDRESILKLEMERRMDEERAKVRQDATAKATEEYRLREREKDKQLDDMRRQIEELKRKAEQGSQQAQGEAQELELEDVLRENFRFDDIEPVAKGTRGADVIQRVRSESGKPCGTILWESKRTRSWNDPWIQKLKDDQREAKADLCVIVSSYLPKSITRFGYYEGVWVSDFISAVGLGMALRSGIQQVAHIKNSMVGVEEKMEIMYQYLSGPEFRNRIEAIIESFKSMKSDLDLEKRSMERIWAKREKQLERMVQNTSGMYGDLQGLIGAQLPSIKALELTPSQEDVPSDPSSITDHEDVPF